MFSPAAFKSVFKICFLILDPTSQLGLTGASDSHWANYNSSYASYAAASSFAYGGGSATGSELTGQQNLADHASSGATNSQIPTGNKKQYY